MEHKRSHFIISTRKASKEHTCVHATVSTAQRMFCAFQAQSIVIHSRQEGPLVELVVIGCMKQHINTSDTSMARKVADMGAF